MLPYGSKRTYGDCRTSRRFGMGKIHVVVSVKNHKHGRQWDKTQVDEPA